MMKYQHTKFSAQLKSNVSFEPKAINKDNIEIRFEHDLLKFRDAQNFSYQESPSVQLMFLASNHGIRPVTTTNTHRNMFFIKQDDIPQFVATLELEHPEFKQQVTQKIEADNNTSDFSKISEW